jgi:hypothetical protein
MIGDGWSLRMAKPYKEMARYGGVGIDLVLAILLLGAFGHWLDGKYFASHDYAMLGGGFLGVAVGVRSLVRAVKRMQRDIEVAEAGDPAGSRWTVDETWVHKVDGDDGPPPHDRPRPPSSSNS